MINAFGCPPCSGRSARAARCLIFRLIGRCLRACSCTPARPRSSPGCVRRPAWRSSRDNRRQGVEGANWRQTGSILVPSRYCREQIEVKVLVVSKDHTLRHGSRRTIWNRGGGGEAEHRHVSACDSTQRMRPFRWGHGELSKSLIKIAWARVPPQRVLQP